MMKSSPTNEENREISLPLDGGGCGWGWILNSFPPSPQSSPARGEEVFSIELDAKIIPNIPSARDSKTF